MRLSVIGLVGALPSLVWMLAGPELMHDDWWLAEAFADQSASGTWDGLVEAATEAPARPGGAIYYAVSYGLFGRSAWLHALLLAMVNAALCILVYLVVERLWRPHLALWVAGFYAVMPNRGSTRLWFAVGNYPLALILSLVGVLLLLRNRPFLAGAVMAAGVLTFEGVAGLAVLAIGSWILLTWSDRWRRGVAAMVPIVIATGTLYLLSPKREGSSLSVGGLDRMLASQFGVGTFESPVVARVAFIAVAAGVVIVIARPGPWREEYRSPVLWGLAILVAGWLPFAVTGWPIGTDGFFDRANGVIGLGTAVICGSLLALVAERAPAHSGSVAGAVVFIGLFSLNLKDLRSYVEAADDGNQLLAQVVADVPPTDSPILVVPPGKGSNGVEQFPFGSNLTFALEAERGDVVRFWINPRFESAPLPDDHLCYNRLQRLIGPCPAEPGQ